MIQPNLTFSSKDPAKQRRQALSKIYSLLIRLAEDAEGLAQAANHMNEQRKILEPVSAIENLVSDEESVVAPKLLRSDFQDRDKTVPLQNNIPS
jgi:hypothetical protein